MSEEAEPASHTEPWRELGAGILIVALGLLSLCEATRYSFGKLSSPGSALFPAIASVVMIVLGICILLVAAIQMRLQKADSGPSLKALMDDVTAAWPVIIICASIVAFYLLLERAGLIISVFASVFVAKLAERPYRFVESILLGAGLAALSVAIFVFLLELPFKLWW